MKHCKPGDCSRRSLIVLAFVSSLAIGRRAVAGTANWQMADAEQELPGEQFTSRVPSRNRNIPRKSLKQEGKSNPRQHLYRRRSTYYPAGRLVYLTFRSAVLIFLHSIRWLWPMAKSRSRDPRASSGWGVCFGRDWLDFLFLSLSLALSLCLSFSHAHAPRGARAMLCGQNLSNR